MLEIKQITLDEYNNFMLSDPRLCWKGLNDQSLDYLYHKGTIIISTDTLIYGFYNDTALICCIHLNHWTEQCAYVHLYLSSLVKDKEIIGNIVETMLQYIKDMLQYRKLVTYIPHTCRHAIWFVNQLGFVKEGRLTKCATWRQKLVDYLIYSLEIK